MPVSNKWLFTVVGASAEKWLWQIYPMAKIGGSLRPKGSQPPSTLIMKTLLLLIDPGKERGSEV